MRFGATRELMGDAIPSERCAGATGTPDVAEFAENCVDTSGPGDKNQIGANDTEETKRVAIHLTPTELAEEVHMQRREVISKCMEMGVPIFNGRIDKTLFVSSLRRFTQQPKRPQAAA